MARKPAKIKVIPLGGLNEIGKNMIAFEYKEDIIVVDCGLSFPEDEMLGIDLVIPDITYLIKNKDKVRGIVLTHGHEDHIGALPYVLKKLNVPVYGTKLTLGLVENKFKEHKINNIVKTQIVKAGEEVKLGEFRVEFIKTSHSIADSVCLAIHTTLGTIVHTGDFKIDYTPIDDEPIDFHRLAELGKKGVMLLLCDSTNVERPGYTMSERTVGVNFENIFRNAIGRIIVATFSSNVHRVQQIINAANKFNRKVAFSGRSMLNVVNVSRELGYLTIASDMLIDINDLNKYPENEIVVITTGSQGEPMSALSRMAASDHKKLVVQPGDLVILSATPIPGNEKTVSRVVNQLFQKGANVIYEALADVHVSGHACQEEIKLMHTLIKPQFFIPVHGEYRHLIQHAKLAESLGMDSENIFTIENGEVVEVSKEGARRAGNVASGNILVDGLGVGDVGNIVLRDRKHLSEDGLMVVVVTMAKESGILLSGPDIISRGFVYVRESEDLMDEARSVVRNSLKTCQNNDIREWAVLKSAIKDSLREFLYQKTKRSPMILPIIMEV
ncbi:MAG: ribonuclease J [Alkaliphilus sp.]|nr:ribonuclease J [Alkaliphilus sp.]